MKDRVRQSLGVLSARAKARPYFGRLDIDRDHWRGLVRMEPTRPFGNSGAYTLWWFKLGCRATRWYSQTHVPHILS